MIAIQEEVFMSERKHMGFHKKWEDFPIPAKILIIVGGIAAFAGLLILLGFIVMWLWNALLPRIFGLPQIGYWEAWGLLILSQILFRGFHGSKHVSERSRRHRLQERIKEMDCDEPETGKNAQPEG
jgi:hypothetical protein